MCGQAIGTTWLTLAAILLIPLLFAWLEGSIEVACVFIAAVALPTGLPLTVLYLFGVWC